VHYVVPNMKLIPQDRTMSCWYASGMMLTHWRRETVLASERAHPDPSQVKKWSKLYDDNPGITNEQILAFASDLGFEFVPPMSPTPEAIQQWLIDYGPLWVNGRNHITVIAGIRDSSGDVEVLVFDPALPNKKHGEWRKLYEWYVLDAHSGRDTSGSVQTVFLHLPRSG
jgi:hypothetical protein